MKGMFTCTFGQWKS